MSDSIRVRVCVAVVCDSKILLVPHYNHPDAPIVWHMPGGKVEHCETLTHAAEREFEEETGYKITCNNLLGYTEAIQPEKSYHGLALAFSGSIIGGELRAEPEHNYGDVDKTPRWFSLAELQNVAYHAPEIVQKVFHD